MHISDCSQFSDIHISQGSVATYLTRGGIFKYYFVANLPVSLPVKEFQKSVNIWRSYGQEFSVLFFETQCTIVVFRNFVFFLFKNSLVTIYNHTTLINYECHRSAPMLEIWGVFAPQKVNTIPVQMC